MDARAEKEKKMLLITNQYLNAMCQKKPENLPLAADLRVTYNGDEVRLGDNEMWKYAIRIPARQTFTDVETNNAVFFGTATNTGLNPPDYLPRENFYFARWYFFFLRLKFNERMEICEVEEIVISQRQNQYNPLEEVNFTQLIYEIPVPSRYRRSREEMVRIVDDYWSAIPKDFPGEEVLCHPDAIRIENGTQSTDSMKFPYSLSTEFGVGDFLWELPLKERRYPIVDVELGLVVSIVVFHGCGDVKNRNTVVIDAFKIDRGLIRQVDCLSRTVDGISYSGWEGWPDNCSIH